MTEQQMSAEELWEQISDEQRQVLERNHFDADEFLELRRAYLAGELSGEGNRLDKTVEVPADDDVRVLPDRDSEQAREFIALGQEAIDNGEVGIVVLNGGMATRFGGVVKGCVNVFDDLSFLGLKALDVRRHGGGTKMLLMNSFATDDKTDEHLAEHDYFGLDDNQLIQFNQNVSIRLTPEGELFREGDDVSFYAPGHGDLPSAVGRSALQKFREDGGKYLLMSNVDNVLATIDPLVVGMHVDAANNGAQMTVEAVQKKPGQVGGFVARVDGEPQVVEHFRLPDASLKEDLQLLNTNTFMFNADALDDDFDLTWFVVDKNVDGDTVIQFERLAGELSAFLKTTFVEVPASGDESRFQPVKRREDLDDNRERLERLVKQRGLL
ncbi:UTP--glucose-1-phosphate uridylyltransferase [Persicimonas caeni]|nr:UTP--glucose-1-phosphate uridylyltransferase [Persicimonas caeni]